MLKDRAQDLVTLLKGSRKAQFFAVLAILGVLFVMFGDSGGPKRTVLRPPAGGGPAKPLPTGDPREMAEDILKVYSAKIDALTKATAEQNAKIEDQERKFRTYELRTAEILKRMLEKFSESQTEAPPAPIPGPEITDEPVDEEGDTIDPFGLEPEAPAPPPAPEAKRVAFVGTGDSVRVKLLAGVNAPTDGTPYPVVFKLIGDVNGPDGSMLPLGEARLIAAAQGSLIDSRALFRLTALNLQLPTGERKVYDVDGWVVGEDGIRGLPGILIDPIGKALLGSGVAGVIQGAGAGLAAANATNFVNTQSGAFSTVVTGDLWEFAAGRGIQQAGNTWANIVQQRLGQLVPVVQVYSGREATAVFARPLAIDQLFEAMEEVSFTGQSLD